MQSETRQCQACKKDFTIEPDDFGFYEQMRVPPPTWCPFCRMQRRFAWYGYNRLHKRTCAKSGDNVITFYHPDETTPIYRQDIWWSDDWDPKEYGRDYDFNKPFFEQFYELYQTVPRPSLHTEYSSMVRSDYVNCASDLKDCYLSFKCDRAEDSAYLDCCSYIKGSFDVSWSNYAELSYESINLEKAYQNFYSQDCADCHDIWFSRDLVGCSNCIGCINLRKQNYHIFNQPYSKEEYEAIFKQYDFGSARNVEEFKHKAQAFFLQHPRRQFHGYKNQDVSGDYIWNSKNVKDSWWVDDGEDIRYGQMLQALHTKKAYDYSAFAYNAEWVYECSWVGINTNNVKFCFWNYTGRDSEYAIGCHGSGNMFGSVGIRQGEYCILNKQYTKEQYNELVPKIKEHMNAMPYTDKLGRVYKYGEFFPIEFCPWAYNEGHAYDYLGKLSKEQATAQGFRWRDPDTKEYQPATIELPDHINDVDESITKEILKCIDCGKNYRIIAKELQFYKRYNLPIPRQCSLCRAQARIKQLNPIEIYDRQCAKCSQAIKTSYAPDRPEIVYCESCYQQEVA